jgi:hypothetical protein
MSFGEETFSSLAYPTEAHLTLYSIHINPRQGLEEMSGSMDTNMVDSAGQKNPRLRDHQPSVPRKPN